MIHCLIVFIAVDTQNLSHESVICAALETVNHLWKLTAVGQPDGMLGSVIKKVNVKPTLQLNELGQFSGTVAIYI